MFGFLNVYKPVGLTSHDVVAKLRKILKIKQIGHTGTLDPFAEGVLPVCIGKATRLIEYLKEDKAYIATLQLGKSTDTFDIEGKITFESGKKISDKEEILDAIKPLMGEIEQLPPIYSAIKVNGKKLYEYARSGEQVEIKPRRVIIKKIDLNEFDEKNQKCKIYIECSKGTYIRSISNDIGKFLGTGAYLTNLVRTKSGKFTLENSVNLYDIIDKEIVENHLINPLDILSFETYKLSDDELEKVKNGQQFVNKLIKNAEFIILVYNNSMKAIANCSDFKVKICKVFEV